MRCSLAYSIKFPFSVLGSRGVLTDTFRMKSHTPTSARKAVTVLTKLSESRPGGFIEGFDVAHQDIVPEVDARNRGTRSRRPSLCEKADPAPDRGIARVCMCRDASNSSTTQTTVPGISGPHDPDAEMAPDLIEVEPTNAAAGEEVSIFFPEEPVRGVHNVAEIKQGEDWRLRYHLLSDWGGEREPESFPAETMEFAVEDVGIGGPWPDVVLIPGDAPPGQYRICTGNMRKNICAPLTIESPS